MAEIPAGPARWPKNLQVTRHIRWRKRLSRGHRSRNHARVERPGAGNDPAVDIGRDYEVAAAVSHPVDILPTKNGSRADQPFRSPPLLCGQCRASLIDTNGDGEFSESGSRRPGFEQRADDA